MAAQKLMRTIEQEERMTGKETTTLTSKERNV